MHRRPHELVASLLKAGTCVVRVWVPGKTVLSPCYTRALSERFGDKVNRYFIIIIKYLFTYYYNITYSLLFSNLTASQILP